MFANSAEFTKTGARQQAMGIDTRKALLVDQYGNTIAHPKTGGMMSPQEHQLKSGTIIWRFASSHVEAQQAILGGWWVETGEFQKLCSFAQQKKYMLLWRQEFFVVSRQNGVTWGCSSALK